MSAIELDRYPGVNIRQTIALMFGIKAINSRKFDQGVTQHKLLTEALSPAQQDILRDSLEVFLHSHHTELEAFPIPKSKKHHFPGVTSNPKPQRIRQRAKAEADYVDYWRFENNRLVVLAAADVVKSRGHSFDGHFKTLGPKFAKVISIPDFDFMEAIRRRPTSTGSLSSVSTWSSESDEEKSSERRSPSSEAKMASLRAALTSPRKAPRQTAELLEAFLNAKAECESLTPETEAETHRKVNALLKMYPLSLSPKAGKTYTVSFIGSRVADIDIKIRGLSVPDLAHELERLNPEISRQIFSNSADLFPDQAERIRSAFAGATGSGAGSAPPSALTTPATIPDTTKYEPATPVEAPPESAAAAPLEPLTPVAATPEPQRAPTPWYLHIRNTLCQSAVPDSPLTPYPEL